MPEFKIHSPYQMAGDQPEAVAKLVEGINNGLTEQTLMGVTGSGKTFTMANIIEQTQRPTLVLAHNKTLAAQLCTELREFFPENAVEYFVSYYDYYQPEAYIASTDTYIEKDSAINDEIDRLRHSATSALSERRDVIIVSSVSCIYSLGDPIDYKSMVISIRPGMEMSREELIRRLFGIESVVFIHFDRTVMQMPWQTFIQTLVDEMDAAAFVVGHDFSFGWRGEGTAEKLTAYCAEHGLGCDVIPAVTLDGRVVSSTYIRELLENGEVERANAFLGHPHTLSDTVHYGYRLGTKMGTPTINMQFPDGVLVPRHGVYAAKVYLDDGSEHYAVTNVGVRPTVSGGQRVSVESFILDYHGNLYNRQVRLEFYKFLRPERKFDSVDALKARILYDANTTRAYFEAQTQHA